MNYHGSNFKETKTCFHCVHGNYDPGYPSSQYDPGQPEMVECQKEEVIGCEDDTELEQWLDANKHLEYYDIAEECSFFEPIIINKCCNCITELKSEQWSHKHWVDGIFSCLPVCGEKCKIELQGKIYDEMVDESARDLEEDIKNETDNI